MPRQGVQYVSNEEPSFIKQFKQRVGYKDGPDINSKKNIPNFDEDDEADDIPEKEDEKPVVVVLKTGDLTAEEAEEEHKQIEEGPARLDEKITFKKPTKRPKDADENSEDKADSKKKKRDNKEGNKSGAKKTANSSLLSFDCDEDEEDS